MLIDHSNLAEISHSVKQPQKKKQKLERTNQLLLETQNNVLESTNEKEQLRLTSKIVRIVNDKCLQSEDLISEKEKKNVIKSIQMMKCYIKCGELISKIKCIRKDVNIFNKIFGSKKIKKGEEIQEKKENNCMLAPDSAPKIIWDLLCMVIILYEMIMIPFRISFSSQDIPLFETIDLIFDSIFLTDILITFNTAIFKKGNLLYNRKVIALQYIKLWFWLDLLSSFPYGLVAKSMVDSNQEGTEEQNQQSLKQSTNIIRIVKFFRFLKIARLLRVVKLKATLQKILSYLNISRAVSAFLGFLRLTFIVLFLAHWLACLWHGIGQSNSGRNWMIKHGVYDSNWDERYISSIYWAVTTMITVGYGDIIPQNELEKIIALFTMLLACAVFGYSMNTMGQMLSQMSQEKEENKSDLMAINRYMKMKKIPLDLQMKIRNYLDYMWSHKRQNVHNNQFFIGIQTGDQFITQKLTSTLRNDFIYEINGRIITQCNLLCDNFSDPLIYFTALIIKETIAAPEEIIFTDNSDEYQDSSLFFLAKGEIEIYLKQIDTVFKKLNENTFFGEIGFISDQRTATVRSSDFCDLFYIERLGFIELISHYPQDLEIFCEMRDQLTLYQNFSKLNLQCFVCQQTGHIASKCSQLNFINDRQQMLKDFKDVLNVFRKQYIRKNYKKVKAWKNIKRMNQDQKEFQENQQDLIQSLNDGIVHYEVQQSSVNTTSCIKQEQSVQKKKLLKKLQIQIFEDPKKILEDREDREAQENKKQDKKDVEITKKEFLYQQHLHEMEEFEKVKEFINYFVHNNVRNVCDSHNQRAFQMESKKYLGSTGINQN